MLDHHRGEWFAIARGKLYHASSRESVVSQLAADGAESGTVLVTRFPFREPFLVL